MDAAEIAQLLVGSDKGITPARIVKLLACAQRAKVDIQDVIEAVPADQRELVRELVGKAR